MATKSNPKSYCSEAFKPEGWKTEHATFSVIGEMCFAIAYNIITPKPEDRFLIFIKGLQKEERSVAVPKIQFEKEARWEWFFYAMGLTKKASLSEGIFRSPRGQVKYGFVHDANALARSIPASARPEAP